MYVDEMVREAKGRLLAGESVDFSREDFQNYKLLRPLLTTMLRSIGEVVGKYNFKTGIFTWRLKQG